MLSWMSKVTVCDAGEQLRGTLHPELVVQQHPDTAAERMVLPEELLCRQEHQGYNSARGLHAVFGLSQAQ